MRPRSISKPSQSHFHYHYHYYYPPHQREAFALTERQKLYSSFLEQKDHEEDKQETLQVKENHRIKTEGDLTLPNSSSKKKMRMSELWINKHEFPSCKSAQRYNLTDIKARSVVEEEVQQFEEESEEMMDHEEVELKSRVTDAETYSHQSQLIAYYKSQLQKQAKQINRLKMVQQECIYLRDAFYGHYTQNCHDR